MPFIENSFLGKQIEKIRSEHIIENKEILLLANDINRDINKILYNLKHTNDNEKDYILIGLLCKIIQSYNSTIILSNYGLKSDAKAILRSMIESTFNFCAIIYDEKYYDKYLRNGDVQTKVLIKNIKNNPYIFPEKILQNLNSEKLKELQNITSGFKKASTKELAESAKMLDIYLYTYNILSLEVHGNVKSIINNYIVVEDETFKELSMLADYDESDFILKTSIAILLKVMEGIGTYFDGNVNDIVKKYGEKLSKII